jgi:hypothetical protein
MPMTSMKNLPITQPGGMMGGVMADLGFGPNLSQDDQDDEKKKREKALGDVLDRTQSALGQNTQFGGAAMDLGYRP